MISLNGVTLDNDLILADEFATPLSVQSIARTRLGTLIVQQNALLKGRKLFLTATASGQEYSGSFTRAQILQFRALEQAGTEVTFIHESQTFQVLVMPGGVQVAPLIPRPNHELTDLFTGTLTLLEV